MKRFVRKRSKSIVIYDIVNLMRSIEPIGYPFMANIENDIIGIKIGTESTIHISIILSKKIWLHKTNGVLLKCQIDEQGEETKCKLSTIGTKSYPKKERKQSHCSRFRVLISNEKNLRWARLANKALFFFYFPSGAEIM